MVMLTVQLEQLENAQLVRRALDDLAFNPVRPRRNGCVGRIRAFDFARFGCAPGRAFIECHLICL